MKKAFLFWLLALPCALATTFANRPMSTVVQEASVIVRGHVGESYSDYDPAGSGRILTYTHVAVDEVLKGSIDGDDVLVRQPGGVKDGTAMDVPGSARFTEGEEVVLLLSGRSAKDQSYDVPGLASGKYEVQDADNGDKILVNSLGTADPDAVYNPDRNKTPGALSYSAKISLDAFRELAKSEKTEAARQTQFQKSTATPASKPNNAMNQVTASTESEPSLSAPGRTLSRRFLLWAGFGLFVVLIALKAKRR